MWKLIALDKTECVDPTYAKEQGILGVVEIRCVDVDSPVHICSTSPSYLCVPVAVCFRMNVPSEGLSAKRKDELDAWGYNDWLYSREDNPYHGVQALENSVPVLPKIEEDLRAVVSENDFVSHVQDVFSDYGGMSLGDCKQLGISGDNDFIVSV